MWASTLWPLVSSTRNIAFGRASTTLPSISMTPSFFAISSANCRSCGSAHINRSHPVRGGVGRGGAYVGLRAGTARRGIEQFHECLLREPGAHPTDDLTPSGREDETVRAQPGVGSATHGRRAAPGGGGPAADLTRCASRGSASTQQQQRR